MAVLAVAGALGLLFAAGVAVRNLPSRSVGDGGPDDPGRDKAGRDKAGRDKAGRDDPGREDAGRPRVAVVG
jgi:hypothetical protein